MNRITILARFLLLPVLVIGDFAVAWSPVAAPLSFISHFGLGYATLVAMVLAFRRRSALGLAAIAGIVLVTAWAINPAVDGPSRIVATLAGIFCAMLPALLRDWQRLAGDDVHMNLGQLRLLGRRRKRSRSSRSNGSKQGHIYLLPAPHVWRGDDPVRDAFEAGEKGRSAR